MRQPILLAQLNGVPYLAEVEDELARPIDRFVEPGALLALAQDSFDRSKTRYAISLDR